MTQGASKSGTRGEPGPGRSYRSVAPQVTRFPPTSPYRVMMELYEKQLLTDALREAKQNITRAAALLGMSKMTFYRRAIALGIRTLVSTQAARRRRKRPRAAAAPVTATAPSSPDPAAEDPTP